MRGPTCQQSSEEAANALQAEDQDEGAPFGPRAARVQCQCLQEVDSHALPAGLGQRGRAADEGCNQASHLRGEHQGSPGCRMQKVLEHCYTRHTSCWGCLRGGVNAATQPVAAWQGSSVSLPGLQLPTHSRVDQRSWGQDWTHGPWLRLGAILGKVLVWVGPQPHAKEHRPWLQAADCGHQGIGVIAGVSWEQPGLACQKNPCLQGTGLSRSNSLQSIIPVPMARA